MRKLVVVAIVFAMALTLLALPASATVHEITGMWCGGQESHYDPPGISGVSSAGNFAQPLFASGAAYVDGFWDDGTNGTAPLINWNWDAPQLKIVDAGYKVFMDGVYVEMYELDTSAGFYNCQLLQS